MHQLAFLHLVNLSLRVIEKKSLKIPDHCSQPVQDAIDREVWTGYTFGSILPDKSNSFCILS